MQFTKVFDFKFGKNHEKIKYYIIHSVRSALSTDPKSDQILYS